MPRLRCLAVPSRPRRFHAAAPRAPRTHSPAEASHHPPQPLQLQEPRRAGLVVASSPRSTGGPARSRLAQSSRAPCRARPNAPTNTSRHPHRRYGIAAIASRIAGGISHKQNSSAATARRDLRRRPLARPHHLPHQSIRIIYSPDVLSSSAGGERPAIGRRATGSGGGCSWPRWSWRWATASSRRRRAGVERHRANWFIRHGPPAARPSRSTRREMRLSATWRLRKIAGDRSPSPVMRASGSGGSIARVIWLNTNLHATRCGDAGAGTS